MDFSTYKNFHFIFYKKHLKIKNIETIGWILINTTLVFGIRYLISRIIKSYLKKLTFKSNNISGELIKEKRNLGFSKGNNAGMRYILDKSDYIMLLNNDTLVDKNLTSDLNPCSTH